MSHVIFNTSRNEYIWMSHVTLCYRGLNKWVMSQSTHIGMNTYGWVMSYIVTLRLRGLRKWVTPHSPHLGMNTYGWVMSNDSSICIHFYVCWLWHDSFVESFVTQCDMTHVEWLIHMCSFLCVSFHSYMCCLIHICVEWDVTHSLCTPYAWIVMYVESNISYSSVHIMSQGDMTHPYGFSFLYVVLIRIFVGCDMAHSLCTPHLLISICFECDMTHSSRPHVTGWHDSSICIYSYKCYLFVYLLNVTWLILCAPRTSWCLYLLSVTWLILWVMSCHRVTWLIHTDWFVYVLNVTWLIPCASRMDWFLYVLSMTWLIISWVPLSAWSVMLQQCVAVCCSKLQ